MHLIYLTVCCHFVALSTASFSGLYVDNGLDRTILQRILSTDEQQNVREQLLDLLGLAEPPRNVTSSTSPLKAPKFLLDAYKSTLESSSRRQARSELDLTERDLQAIEDSDMIMSFVSKGNHPNASRHGHGKLLWFDVADFPLSNSLVSAELRVFQTYDYSRSDKSLMTVSLFSVSYADNGLPQMSLVDSVNTTADKEGWLVFNVTASLSYWSAFPESNQGFYVTTRLSSSDEIPADEIGLVTDQNYEDEARRPFMVAFLTGPSDVNHRVTRQARHRRKKERSDYTENPPRHFFDQNRLWSQPQKSCQIQTLYVSFKDLKWQDWIIAPDGYGAFYCSGECNFPLNAHMNATNHAIVQTLVHLMKPNIVPKPCCAPTKLTPISVLYFVDDSNVMLKRYKNMVVKSCGCH